MAEEIELKLDDGQGGVLTVPIFLPPGVELDLDTTD